MFIKIIAVKCIIEEGEKILLIKESTTSSWKPGKWGLPGGKVDPREDIIRAAHREMHEETGLKVKIKGLFRIEEMVEQFINEDRLVHHYILLAERLSGKLKKLTMIQKK
jgi:ADP-ribose pyrophosphatase YjhB (NUDIX family)